MTILKKGLLFGFLIIFLSTANITAQSNSLIIGYDRVQLGSTVETIIQKYSGLKECISENYSIGIREFSEINIGDSIYERRFYFYQNKLYKVFLNYNESDAETVNMILDRYGIFGGNEEHNRKLISFKNVDNIKYFKNNGINVNQINKKLEDDLYLMINLEGIDPLFNAFNFNFTLFDSAIQKKIDEILIKREI